MTYRRNSILVALGTVIVCGTLASGVVAAKKQRGTHKTATASATASGSAAPASPASPAGAGIAPAPSGQAGQQVARQESRIEFDERSVRGQSASGVIYLFQRSPSDFTSIVQVPESFRPRTVEVLAPHRDEP